MRINLVRIIFMIDDTMFLDLIAYEGVEWGRVTSGAVLLLLPMLFFAYLTRKYIVKGLLGGAIKG